MLVACGLAVGCGVLAVVPEMATYRGLSGVDSGQFAAALCVEADLARRDRSRWFWLGPLAAIVAVKILWELSTGQMFFGTESMGDIGLPVPVAHAVGAATAAAFVVVQRGQRCQRPQQQAARTRRLAGAKRHRIEPWCYVRELPLRLHADDPRLDEMLPDRWAAAHPEAVLTHRLDESRAKAARTRARRAHRRAHRQ